MLSIITYKDHSGQVEIVGDDKGLQELINYLIEVKQSKDHMHLIIGNELDEYPIPDNRKHIVGSANAVLIEYFKKEDL